MLSFPYLRNTVFSKGYVWQSPIPHLYRFATEAVKNATLSAPSSPSPVVPCSAATGVIRRLPSGGATYAASLAEAQVTLLEVVSGEVCSASLMRLSPL